MSLSSKEKQTMNLKHKTYDTQDKKKHLTTSKYELSSHFHLKYDFKHKLFKSKTLCCILDFGGNKKTMLQYSVLRPKVE